MATTHQHRTHLSRNAARFIAAVEALARHLETVDGSDLIAELEEIRDQLSGVTVPRTSAMSSMLWSQVEDVASQLHQTSGAFSTTSTKRNPIWFEDRPACLRVLNERIRDLRLTATVEEMRPHLPDDPFEGLTI